MSRFHDRSPSGGRQILICAAFAVSLTLIILVGVDFSRTGDRLRESNRWLSHTYGVLTNLEEVYTTLVEAETGRRGYVLTGNNDLLAQYEASVRAVPRKLSDLTAKVQDNPSQQRRMELLLPAVQRKLDNLRRSIGLRQSDGYQSADQARLTSEGAQLMQDVRETINGMKAVENGLLVERRAAEDASMNRLLVTSVFGMISSALLLALSFILALREGRGHMKAAQALGEKTAALEQSNREITSLAKMSELLQQCQTLDEAYGIIRDFGRLFFPGTIGGIYIITESRSTVHLAGGWGDSENKAFHPDDCWGLRRGQFHVVPEEPVSIRCAHVGPDIDSYICIPLVTQHETLGLLHVVFPTGTGLVPVTASSAAQLIATQFADRISLAIGNLKLRARLQELSIRDPLTGLLNRRYMEEALEREIARSSRTGLPMGVLMLDVDHFKRFNDTFGHEAGDVVLKEVGGYLRGSVRASDIACRFGGEEFALILPEATAEAVRKKAEEIREGISKLHVNHGSNSLGTITISAGVAAYPTNGAFGEDVVAAADRALYDAKRAGRNCVRSAEG